MADISVVNLWYVQKVTEKLKIDFQSHFIPGKNKINCFIRKIQLYKVWCLTLFDYCIKTEKYIRTSSLFGNFVLWRRSYQNITLHFVYFSFHLAHLALQKENILQKITQPRDHPFKTSANFHNFWPLPPYHRHSSKMLMKGIFEHYLLWPFDHWHMGTPLPPKTCWRFKWMVHCKCIRPFYGGFTL